MKRFGLSVHLVISNAALASDENGYGIHKNVGEYRDEERSRTGTCILVRKGLETEWNEVIPRGGSKVVPSNAKSWFIWGSVNTQNRNYGRNEDEITRRIRQRVRIPCD